MDSNTHFVIKSVRKKRRDLSVEEIKGLIDELKAGSSVGKLAEKYEVTTQCIRKYKNNLSTTKKKLTKLKLLLKGSR